MHDVLAPEQERVALEPDVAATGILGSFGLMIFGHRRVLAIAIVLLVVALSTVAGDALQSLRWRMGSPSLRRLLSDS